MRRVLFFVLFVICFLTLSSPIFAKSSYVLPYPSAMPGGIQYKLHLVWEAVSKYWYFGDFGQFEYSLKESDKYLVESKTLFDYEQYLLAVQALQKSDGYFAQTNPHLLQAEQNGKDISDKQQELREAAAKHIEVLESLEKSLPSSVHWQPEKAPASDLPVKNLIDSSIRLRQQYE